MQLPPPVSFLRQYNLQGKTVSHAIRTRRGYRRKIEGSVAKRAGTPDEVAAVGALLMRPDGGFITGSDFLMDGGVTASYWYSEIAEVREQ